MFDYLLIFVLGLVTSFAANITGGGGALIMLPVLVWVGLSPIEAIGTLIFGALGFVIGSAASIHGRGIVRRDHLIGLLAAAIPGSILGPLISTNLPADKVKAISSILIVITAIMSLLTWRVSSHARNVRLASQYSGYFLYFVTTTLLAGFTSGVGLLGGYILIGLVGMSPIETIVTRRIVGLVALPIQVSIYALSGQIHLLIGLVLNVSNFIGAYLGINYAVKKGNDFIKKTMAVAAIILVILLLI